MSDSPTRVRIAHSPDSDDAFMFYALTQGLCGDNPARYPEVMSDIDYIGGKSGVPRWQSHVDDAAGPIS